MREQPWNARLASTQHFRQFRNLADIHALTSSWAETQPGKMDVRAEKLPFPETAALLNSLGADDSALTRLLDDTSPDDILGRLEQVVDAAQVETLKQVVASGRSEDELKRLAELSHQAGRNCAEKRWQNADSELRKNLRGLLSLCEGAPLFGGGVFLVRRSTPQELQAELRKCPHTSELSDTGAPSDLLCSLRVDWLRGFLSSLNPDIRVEHTMGKEKGHRCLLKWALP